MSGQRYVSDELTHFVGRHLAGDEARYGLLVEILRTGTLAPHEPGAAGDVAIDLSAPVSSNRAYEPEMVCFSDIPVGDLDLHIRKYTPFGLAFQKPLLVARGATPVFYVAAAAPTQLREGEGARVATRAEALDRAAALLHRLRAESQARRGKAAPADARLLADVDDLARLLDFEVFSYLKFFEYPLDDADPSNFYMEREWRLLGELRFGLGDVRRVVLPEAYAARLRADVPGYAGQVTFGGHGA
ncbi:MAG TPA: abortive infection system antitoxin AbiGi family protein [Candidatus Thermoplasmatota archaeon]|nr:abortive infection system antitoxin AbiGi family protein [Candidatus Thermoplasmatota archaeon]